MPQIDPNLSPELVSRLRVSTTHLPAWLVVPVLERWGFWRFSVSKSILIWHTEESHWNRWCEHLSRPYTVKFFFFFELWMLKAINKLFAFCNTSFTLQASAQHFTAFAGKCIIFHNLCRQVPRCYLVDVVEAVSGSWCWVTGGVSWVLEVGDVLGDGGAAGGGEEETTYSKPFSTGSITIASNHVTVSIGKTLTCMNEIVWFLENFDFRTRSPKSESEVQGPSQI